MSQQDLGVAASESHAGTEAGIAQCRPLAADALIVLRTARGLRFEPPADIAWLQADRNNVVFHIRGETVVVRVKLSDLESTLDANRFVRINRSNIVNLAHVKEAVALEGGLYVFEMRSGKRLRSSRGRARQLRRLAASVRLW
jgi:two-component system LytT family response regulator